MHRSLFRRPLPRLTSAVVAVAMIISLGASSPAGADPTGRTRPEWLPPKAQVSTPRSKAPVSALPRRGGQVKVTEPALPKRWKKKAKGPKAKATTTQTLSMGAGAAPLKAVSASTTASPKVALRALVIVQDSTDFGRATWTTTLDAVGALYDVLDASRTSISADTLVDSSGNGRYNAILLTNSMMLKAGPGGSYSEVVDPTEWNVLWAYERDYGVRQATLFASHGTFPEDYCLRPGSEGPLGDTVLPATLTSAGSGVFDYLRPGAVVPLVQSYVYRNKIESGCGTALLTAGNATLGVTSTSPDGRERAALTFSNNQYLLQSTLLTYGLFRWASRGMFLGQRQHYLKLDVDDYFGGADLINPDRSVRPDAYRMSASDVLNVAVRQSEITSRHPVASGFRMGMAHNGAGVVTPLLCNPFGGGTSLMPATTKCVTHQFEWINHTWSHENMNTASLSTASAEIAKNIAFSRQFPLPIDADVLKTGEYSGLGAYNPSGDSVQPPTDFGLDASNPALLQAATAQGVKYLHGNMSFPHQVPSCFNCNVVHPLAPNLSVVPDWPTNIAYFSSTPQEEETFYNWYYGPGGIFPSFPANQTYDQIIDRESDVALGHMATGSMYSHTMHIANLRNYGGGRTLATDWLNAAIGKYAKYFSVPLLSPRWGDLADSTTARNAHSAALPGVTAMYDPANGTVVIDAPNDAQIQLTGVRAADAQMYGTSVQSTVALRAGVPLTVAASGLP